MPEIKRNLRPPNLAKKIKKTTTPKKPEGLVEKKQKVKELNTKTSIAKALDKGINAIQKKSFKSDKEVKQTLKEVGYDISDCAGDNVCITKAQQAKRKIITLNSEDWVLTTADMITSFNTTEDGHTVTQNSIPYINKKKEGITSEDLIKYYDTFIGAFVFLNHVQEEKEQKGVILDGTLRSIHVGEKADGSKEEIFYCRGLLAVNKQDDPLLHQAVKDNKINYVSMGSWYSNKKCSKCGAKGLRTDTHDTRCVHLKLALGEKYEYQDDNQDKQISQITELWDDIDASGKEGGMGFFEISLLSINPAWAGASTQPLTPIDFKNQEISFELDEAYLAKPAFKKYLDNGQIKTQQKDEYTDKLKKLKERRQGVKPKEIKNSMGKPT